MAKNKILLFANINDFIFFPENSKIFKIYKKLNEFYYSLFVVPFIKNLRKNNEVVVVCTDNETKNFMKKREVKSKIIFDYPIENKVKRINENILSIVDNSEFCKIIKKNTKHANTSLLELSKLGLCSYLSRPISSYEMLNSAIKMEMPDKIISIDRNGVYGTVASLAAENNKIALSHHNFMSLSRIKTKILDTIFPSMVRAFRKRESKKPKTDVQIEYLKDAKTNKILVFTGSSHHIDMIVPWVKELRKNKKNNVLVVGLFDSKEGYKKYKIKFELFDNYITDEIFKRIGEQTDILKGKWDELKRDENFKKLVTYENKNIWKIMKNEFTSLFLNVFPKVFEYFEISCSAIETIKPDIVVVLNDINKFGRSAVTAGKFKNVKTLMVQHGMLDKFAKGPSIVENIAAFGDNDKKFLMKRGFDGEKIFITGQPRFDKIFTRKFDKKRVYKELNLDSEKKIVVFTAQLALPAQESILSNIIKTMKEFSDLKLVVKLHPLDQPDLPNKIIKKHNSDAIIMKDIDIHELLYSCEIMITETSTTVLEAIALNKPVIIMNLGNQHEDTAAEKSGCAIGVHNKEELKVAIKKISQDKKTKKNLGKNRKKFIYSSVYKTDGKASERVRKLIEKIMGQSIQ